MEYQEIVTAYKNNRLDISSLKKRLEMSKLLNGRERYRTLDMLNNSVNFNNKIVDLQITSEIPERVGIFEKSLEELLNDYYFNLIYSIKENKAWNFMNLIPSEYSKEKFDVLSKPEKFKIIYEINRKYQSYLEFQKIADSRDCIKKGNDLDEGQIKALAFMKLMFSSFKNKEIEKEFFCFDKKFLMSLISFKRSKIIRLDEYMRTKKKSVQFDYEKYSVFFSTEDFRDIIENLILTSKTIKMPLTHVIEIFYEFSESEAEQSYLNDEYNSLKELEKKYLVMNSIKIEVEKEKRQKQKIELERKLLEEGKRKAEEIEKRQKEAAERIKKAKEKTEIIKSDSKSNEDIKQVQEEQTVKEQVNPLIFSWFEREDITLTRRVGSKNLTEFFNKIKKIEAETGIRVSLFIITNTGKEVSLKRFQEFQKKARAQGLPRLVEGVLGGYSSFRIDRAGNIMDISKMSEANRAKIIALLEKASKFYLLPNMLEETETNYLRYQFSNGKDNSITKQYLAVCIGKLLSNENIKKQPLKFLPFIEKNASGIDVLLSSQLEGMHQLPDYYKSKYHIAPGKTLRANIDTLQEFLEPSKQEEIQEH